MRFLSIGYQSFSWVALALTFSLSQPPAAGAQVAPPPAAPAPTPPLAANADTLGPHPRTAGRRSDYLVAPGVTYHYERPRQLRWLSHIPRDLSQLPAYAFRRENAGLIGGVLSGSVALWVADQPITAASQRFGRFVGLTAQSTQTTLVHIPFSVGGIDLPFEFNVPDNLNSTFYYLGDGWTHLSIATSFWVYGLVKRDNRAAQTASQLGTAVLSTGLLVQTLKRLTGRQSPYVATKERGEWHLFPSYNRYQHFVPNYDAFPTGHLATAMATVTVIAENYPEKKFVRPIGYGLMGLLGYAMLNNGVHWASDYPVGIALGYGMARIAVRNGRTRVSVPGPTPPAGPGTGWQAPAHPQPWYRQAQFSPYVFGPFTGVSANWQL